MPFVVSSTSHWAVFKELKMVERGGKLGETDRWSAREGRDEERRGWGEQTDRQTDRQAD